MGSAPPSRRSSRSDAAAPRGDGAPSSAADGLMRTRTSAILRTSSGSLSRRRPLAGNETRDLRGGAPCGLRLSTSPGRRSPCPPPTRLRSPDPDQPQHAVDIEAQKAAAAVVTLAGPDLREYRRRHVRHRDRRPGIPYGDTGNTWLVDNYKSCVGCWTARIAPRGPGRYVRAARHQRRRATVRDTRLRHEDVRVRRRLPDIVGCSDDECGVSFPFGWKSLIQGVTLSTGHVLLRRRRVLVDGLRQLRTSDQRVGVLRGPTALRFVARGPPVCHDGYYDSYNAGCNSVPPSFANAPCNAIHATTTICGTYGVYDFSGLTYRDTDWYRLPWRHPLQSRGAPPADTRCSSGSSTETPAAR